MTLSVDHTHLAKLATDYGDTAAQAAQYAVKDADYPPKMLESYGIVQYQSFAAVVNTLAVRGYGASQASKDYVDTGAALVAGSAKIQGTDALSSASINRGVAGIPT